jgi:DNA-binding MarR family transcriptional regulator
MGSPHVGSEAPSPVVSEFARGGRALGSAQIAFNQALAECCGLHPTDHLALGALFDEGPMTAGELCERTGLTSGSITALVDRLERAGHVRRERDSRDRRKVIVAPVQGTELQGRVRELFGHLDRAFAQHLADLSEEEGLLLLDFMRRTEAALRQATEELKRF